MNDMLLDLVRHQEWADAEHWRAVEQFPGALDDRTIRARLQHFHLTQRAFLTIIKEEPLVLPRLEELPDMTTLKQMVMAYHRQLGDFLKDATEERLARTLTIPWFKEPPIVVTVTQALMQVTTHSHYHRAQNAARLRELGGKPTTTDLVFWYWKGRPEPQWQ